MWFYKQTCATWQLHAVVSPMTPMTMLCNRLISYVLTEGCLRGLGFSSINEFTEDYKKKENNARQKAWRDKNKEAVNTKERARKAAEYERNPEKEQARKRREHEVNKDEAKIKRKEEYDPDKEHLRKAKQYTQFSPSLFSSHLSRLFSFFSSWFRSCSRRFLARTFSWSRAYSAAFFSRSFTFTSSLFSQTPCFLFCIVFLPVEVVYELTDTRKAKSPQAALCQLMRKQPLLCCFDLLTSRRSIPYDPHDHALQQTRDLHASILLHTKEIL